METQATAAVATPAQTAGPTQPAQPQIPEGKMLVDRAEYERNGERMRGMQGYFDAGQKFGLKKPEDFQSIGKMQSWEKTLKDKGFSPEEILAALTPQEQAAAQQATAAGVAPEDVQKMIAEAISKHDARSTALKGHESATTAEKALVDKFLKETLGENSSTRDKFLMENALRAMLDSKRSIYPEGHLLRDEYLTPYDEKSASALFEDFKKQIAVSEGTDMAALGKDAAKSKPVATPAGNRAGQGKADDNQSKSPRAMLRAAVERAHANRNVG